MSSGEAISELTQFTLMDVFVYKLSSWNLNVAEAKFENNALNVFLPQADVKHWANSLEVGIETSQSNGTEYPLHILIEKDFACLAPRHDEDESDNFPNPATGVAKC